MTKKRIADLLKEEIEKSDEGAGGDEPANPEQTSKTKARKPAAAKADTAKSAAKTSAAKATSTGSKATATKATANKATATKAAAKPDEALTQKIAALETALQKNAEQVAALRADVDTHQSRIFELKDALQDAETASQKKDAQLEDLTAKLAEAKQTIMKLTEAKESTPEPAPEPAAEKESEAAKRQSLQLKQRSPYSGYKSIPEYAIQRGTPAGGQNNSMMNDDDLGWVD